MPKERGSASTSNRYTGKAGYNGMKYVNTVALAGALVWLVGCATASRVVVTEPVGPGPLAGSPGRGDGSLVIYSARAPADVDVNIAEWRYNNDFGRNDFLYEPDRKSTSLNSSHANISY